METETFASTTWPQSIASIFRLRLAALRTKMGIIETNNSYVPGLPNALRYSLASTMSQQSLADVVIMNTHVEFARYLLSTSWEPSVACSVTTRQKRNSMHGRSSLADRKLIVDSPRKKKFRNNFTFASSEIFHFRVWVRENNSSSYDCPMFAPDIRAYCGRLNAVCLIYLLNIAFPSYRIRAKLLRNP